MRKVLRFDLPLSKCSREPGSSITSLRYPPNLRECRSRRSTPVFVLCTVSMVHDWNVLQAELALASGAERTNRRPPRPPVWAAWPAGWRGCHRLVSCPSPICARRGAGAVILAFPARSAWGLAAFQSSVIANWQRGDILVGRPHGLMENCRLKTDRHHRRLRFRRYHSFRSRGCVYRSRLLRSGGLPPGGGALAGFGGESITFSRSRTSRTCSNAALMLPGGNGMWPRPCASENLSHVSSKRRIAFLKPSRP